MLVPAGIALASAVNNQAGCISNIKGIRPVCGIAARRGAAVRRGHEALLQLRNDACQLGPQLPPHRVQQLHAWQPLKLLPQRCLDVGGRRFQVVHRVAHGP